MAHYAEIDQNNIVIRVVVIANEDEPTEQAGIEFCQNLFGGGRWLKTSYNDSIRVHFAGIGYLYDQFRDAFIPPRPYESWILDEQNCVWQAPSPYPTDGQTYIWDDYTRSWRSYTPPPLPGQTPTP